MSNEKSNGGKGILQEGYQPSIKKPHGNLHDGYQPNKGQKTPPSSNLPTSGSSVTQPTPTDKR